MNTLWVCVFKIFLNNSPRVFEMGKVCTYLHINMSMWKNAGRFRRAAQVTGSSSDWTDEDEDEDGDESMDGNECSGDEGVVNPPSTLEITRREQDFGLANADVRPKQPQHEIPNHATSNPTRDFIPIQKLWNDSARQAGKL